MVKQYCIGPHELYEKYRRANKHKRLSLGNSKLAKGVGIFNLPAVDSCRRCRDCMGTCYALQAQRQYPNVRDFRNLNFHLSKANPAMLKRMIIDQIEKQKLTMVRVHESGDFFSSSYVEMWYDIADSLPDVEFYAYTKCMNFDDIQVERLSMLSNFNLIDSFINGKRNYGSKAYVTKLVEEQGCFLCPAEGCMSTCKHCLHHDKVVFEIHGSMKGKDEYENSKRSK